MSDANEEVKWTLDHFALLSAFFQSVPGEWVYSEDRTQAVREGGSRVVAYSEEWLNGNPLLGYYHGGTRATLQTSDEDEMIAQLRAVERRR